MPKQNVYSIIIVVKHDRGLAVTLDHLRPMAQAAAYEVLVVDGSPPEALADIKNNHPWVRWVQFPVSNKRTTPAQRNCGLELARGEVIIFIDANCVPAAGWLGAIRHAMERGEDIVCGPVLDSNQSNMVHYAPTHESGKYVDICTTINVAMTRHVVDAVGRFDTSFAYGQDIDFFWRAKDAGFAIYYDPQVSISHDWGKPKEQIGRAYQYGKARAHLFKKHWSTRKAQLLREPHVWAYPLFLLGLPVSLVFPWYLLLLGIPLLKNRSRQPIGVVVHHMAYGIGVLAGAMKVWPKSELPSGEVLKLVPAEESPSSATH